MPEAVRYSDTVTIRCQPELTAAVNRAALRKGSKPAEYLRQAVLAALQRDGFQFLPPVHEPQFALVRDGQLVLSRVPGGEGSPITSFVPQPTEEGEWLPIENEDSAPFDLAKHWRLKPLALRVDGRRVVREFPVVVKSMEFA
jgi:hypothetical protein